jgi:radical SAM protein with 4Fe4S-binding SPASM domain
MIKILSTDKQIKKFLGIEPLQTASFRVTMACNLKCTHCYSIAGKKLSNELSLNEIKEVMNQLKQLGCIRIFFTGGEPFIRSDIFEILKYADDNSFAIYISTNGTLIDFKAISFLRTLKHLRTFQISLDGLSKTHDSIRGVKGTFNKAIHTIKLAKNKLRNTKIAIISTLMRKNINEMCKLLELAIKLKIDIFGIVTLYPVKRSPEAEDVSTIEKYKLFKKLTAIYTAQETKLKLGFLVPPAIIPSSMKELEYGCGYICTFPSYLGINANGDVAPCDGLLNYKEFILGNVREVSLEKIWDHPLMRKLRRIKPNDIRGVCRKCKFLSFCMGGCRARAYLEYGDFKAPHPLCQSFYENGLFSPSNLKK